MQAMDASHVALVSLNMGMDLFEDYRCDVPIQLGKLYAAAILMKSWIGVSMTTLSKILKLANSEDSLILSATEDPNNLTMRFESKGNILWQDCDIHVYLIDEKKSVNFKINLLNIDAEHLGIPDTEYAATVTMNSNEFAKNIHDLYSLADTVQIEAESGHVKMSIEGDMGQGEIELIENNSTHVQADAPVKLSFSLRYLNMFTKAASLSP